MAKKNPENAPVPNGSKKAPKKIVVKSGRPRLAPDARKDKRVSSDPDYRKKVREGKMDSMSESLEKSKPQLAFQQNAMGGVDQLLEPEEKFDQGLSHTHAWAPFKTLDFSKPGSVTNAQNKPVDPESRAGANFVGKAVRMARDEAESRGFPTQVWKTPDNVHTIYVRGRCRSCDGGAKRPLKPLI
jgi:hypothetical protein